MVGVDQGLARSWAGSGRGWHRGTWSSYSGRAQDPWKRGHRFGRSESLKESCGLFVTTSKDSVLVAVMSRCQRRR